MVRHKKYDQLLQGVRWCVLLFELGDSCVQFISEHPGSSKLIEGFAIDLNGQKKLY